MIKFDMFVITLLSNILGSFLAKDGGVMKLNGLDFLGSPGIPRSKSPWERRFKNSNPAHIFCI